MKIVFVNDLEADSILAKDVINSSGMLLLKKGTRVSRQNIKVLKKNVVLLVYIQDDLLSDIKTDEKLDKLKENAIQQIPDIFEKIVSGNHVESAEVLKPIENLVDHVISEGEVNTNLFEVRTFDDYTYIHSVDTCIMATLLGLNIGFDKEKLKKLSTAAVLHDIGKTKIKREIINKKGKLSKEECIEMRKHPTYGKEILSNMKDISNEIISAVEQHHERVDGKGYPYKLRGSQINEYAKIISICDVFTAVSANRSYRVRFDPKEAYELVLSGADVMFDRDIVQEFRNTFFVYPLGCHIRLSNGIGGYVARQNKFFPDRPVIRIINYETAYSYEIDLLENPSIAIDNII